MIIVGGNLDATSFGKTLKDGGAALIVDGRLVYVSNEERHTRVKADGGYKTALEAGLRYGGWSSADKLYVSSCCESKRPDRRDVKYTDHHLSHAALAFHTSGFTDALVIVADAGGNVLDKQGNIRWWESPREQLSIFHGKGDTIELQKREFADGNMCGFGEFFRAFTYLLGWSSGRHAGKLMALAAFGSTNLGDETFYTIKDGHLVHKADFFDPREPARTAKSFLRAVGREDLISDIDEIDNFEIKAMIAALVQRDLERHFVAMCRKWLDILHTNNICLAGGVAMNCKMALEIRRQTSANIYIPPGANDMGQCLGNAILGCQRETGVLPTISNLVFLGPDYKLTPKDVEDLTSLVVVPVALLTLTAEWKNKLVARALSDGELVFWFQGRSEFGPRALGARSILADPSRSNVREKLNKVKRREFFNPFAASCLFEDAGDFFEDSVDSPYMTMAFIAKQSIRDKIAAVVHQDGTCRAQIFKREFNPEYYDLITAFKEISGLSLVLNTSLNGPGEPIVEKPSEAVELFNRYPEVNILVLNDHILIKSGEWFTRNKKWITDEENKILA